MFSYDRQDRALTGTSGHLGFICTEETRVRVYSCGGREARKIFTVNISNVINIIFYFSRFLPKRPPPPK